MAGFLACHCLFLLVTGTELLASLRLLPKELLVLLILPLELLEVGSIGLMVRPLRMEANGVGFGHRLPVPVKDGWDPAIVLELKRVQEFDEVGNGQKHLVADGLAPVADNPELQVAQNQWRGWGNGCQGA